MSKAKKERVAQPAARRWRQWKESEAREALARWRRSGLSAAEYSAQHGYSQARLRYWSERLGNELAGGGSEIKFVAVPLRPPGEAATAAGQIEIIRDGVILRVREDLDADHVARLVSALARVGSRC